VIALAWAYGIPQGEWESWFAGSRTLGLNQGPRASRRKANKNMTAQPPAVAIRADLAAAPNVVIHKSSAVCGQGILCKHLTATVRYGEPDIAPADWWASGECGEILLAILDGINAGEFEHPSANTWTRIANEGWSLSIAGQQVRPRHVQTITMDGDRPVQITLSAEGAGVLEMGMRSIRWTVEYIRANVAGRALDLPARSVLVVQYLNDHRVVVRSRFDNYRTFRTSSTLAFDEGRQK